MRSSWDAPSDRDVLSMPYDPALDDEEPEMAVDDPAASSFTEDVCPF